MRTLKLTLAYDGTEYAGWQSQPHGRTIQDVFETALHKITGESQRVTASGRTDAGVHARGQVLSLSTTSGLPTSTLQRALNAELPTDIVVLDCAEAPEDFHAIRWAKRKRYRYQLDDGEWPDVFARRFAWRVFPQLDIERMERAAQAFLGRHDFASFQTGGAERLSTIRTVFDISWRRGRAGQGAGDLVQFEIEADGFLYNMVRNLVGTLTLVGRGKEPESWTAEVLAALDRRAAGPTAPPHGLTLLHVIY